MISISMLFQCLQFDYLHHLCLLYLLFIHYHYHCHHRHHLWPFSNQYNQNCGHLNNLQQKWDMLNNKSLNWFFFFKLYKHKIIIPSLNKIIIKQMITSSRNSSKPNFRVIKKAHVYDQTLRHQTFLANINNSRKIYPRYDILSQNGLGRNNLILHVDNNWKENLKPKRDSKEIYYIRKQLQMACQSANIRKIPTSRGSSTPSSRFRKFSRDNFVQWVEQLSSKMLSSRLPESKPEFQLFTYQQAPNNIFCRDKVLGSKNKRVRSNITNHEGN